ncbi:hypothetical protein [Loktanella salsilacus]|uniref:hypothetical protein n=1 Tax=Loktanella salsilacus TaxID=195913 RepID=UPI0037356C41
MGKDLKLEHELIQQAYAKVALFRDAQAKSKQTINYSAFSAYSKLAVANNLALAAMCCGISHSGSLSKREITENDRNIATIIAHFVQSIDAVEICISNGMYAAASTLVRRNMEAVEACRGCFEGKQKEGRTPVLKALKHFGRLYGNFSGLAHNSGFTLMKHLSGSESASIDPIENKEFGKILLGVHIYCVLGISDALRYTHQGIHESRWLADQRNFHQKSLDILIEERILIPSTDESLSNEA